MTMIMTWFTKDYVIQASDRRLSYKDGTKEDASNKAIIYQNYFVFAYTGTANLADQSYVIDWASQKLSERNNLNDAVIHLGNCASDLMNSDLMSHHDEKSRRLAFVGAGFANIKLGEDILNRWPLRIIISNFWGGNETWLTQPKKEFTVHFDWFPKNTNFKLSVAGQKIHKDRHAELFRHFSWCFRHKIPPEEIGRRLALEIQSTAERNGHVGKNIMCTFVPKNFCDNIRLHIGGVLLEKPVNSTKPQSLRPVEIVSIKDRFTILPPFDDSRYVYIAGDNKALPYENPDLVIPGKVIKMRIDKMEITVPPFIPNTDLQKDNSSSINNSKSNGEKQDIKKKDE